MTTADILKLAQSSGLAHNNGAGGQYLLCATEAQLAAFVERIRQETREECAKLREFARDVLKEWPESGPDVFDLQEIAIKHGMLKADDPPPSAPCKEEGGCWCADYYSDEEFADGSVQCYRRTPLLTGAIRQQREIET